jgi:hypothetical protein
VDGALALFEHGRRLTDQTTLPLRHGGLGLAYTGPGCVELRAPWEALNNGAADLWPPEVCEVSLDSLGVNADAQSTYSRHTAEAKFNALQEPFHACSVAGEVCTGLPPKLRLPSRYGLAGHPPHCRCPRAQEWRSADRPPTPPPDRPQRDAHERGISAAEHAM